MLQTVLNCHSLPLWGGERKRNAVTIEAKTTVVSIRLALQADALENAVRDLLAGSKPENNVSLCVYFTVPTGTERHKGGLPAFSRAFHVSTLLFAR